MIVNDLKINNKDKRSKKIFNIIITTFILIFFQAYDNYRRNFLDYTYLKIKKFESSYSKSFIDNFFFETYLSETKRFRETNVNNILTENISFKNDGHPDVSVIIIVYNQANCFHKALRSVQNQSLKNIEIIIIDDCSLDNSTEIINEFMEEDERIILKKLIINSKMFIFKKILLFNNSSSISFYLIMYLFKK